MKKKDRQKDKKAKQKAYRALKADGKLAMVPGRKGHQNQQRMEWTKILQRLSGILDPRKKGADQTWETQEMFATLLKSSRYGPLVMKNKEGFGVQVNWRKVKEIHSNFRKKTPVKLWSSKGQGSRKTKDCSDDDRTEGVWPSFCLFVLAIVYIFLLSVKVYVFLLSCRATSFGVGTDYSASVLRQGCWCGTPHHQCPVCSCGGGNAYVHRLLPQCFHGSYIGQS